MLNQVSKNNSESDFFMQILIGLHSKNTGSGASNF